MKSSKMVFADNQKEEDTVSHYKHLSIEERESLCLGVNQGKSIRRMVLSRIMRKFVCRLRLNEVSRQ